MMASQDSQSTPRAPLPSSNSSTTDSHTHNSMNNGHSPVSPATGTVPTTRNYILLDKVGPFTLLTPEDPIETPVAPSQSSTPMPNSRLRIRYT